MSKDNELIDLVKYFQALEDPRVERQKLHSLSDILFIVFCGVLCGSESCRDLVDYAESKLDFIRRYIPLKNGVPSKSTFNRVLSCLDPKEFKACFIDWVKDFNRDLGDVIAIDGKTLRRSYDGVKGTSTIHIVSAFASEARLVLAQERVDEKSNEITAIPDLLNMLSLNKSVVTIDAMGCQKAIAKKIVTGKGHYVLAVKGNQNKLYESICKHFNNLFDMRINKYVSYHSVEEKNRNRIETRSCYATEKLETLKGVEGWEGIKSCIAIESKRLTDKKESIETRYYISSLPANAEHINTIVRAHWGIENALHWTLDVVFGEDYCRIRDKNLAENMAMVRHVTLNKLQAAKPLFRKGTSLKGLRKKAGWDNDTLDTILQCDI